MAILKPRKKRTRARRVAGISGAPKKPGRAADSYFQNEVDNKQIVELVKSWIKGNFTKSEAKTILKQPDWKFSFPHWACIIYTNDNSRMNYLRGRIASMISTESEKDKKKKSIPVKDPTKELFADLETVVDNQDIDFEFYQYAKIKNMNRVHIKKIVEYYNREYGELLEARDGKSKDLKEAWGYLGRVGLNKRIKFFEKMVSELEKHINNKKIMRRPRKPKVKSASQLVKNIKYLTESNDLQIVSIDPTSLLDAKQLWVYNVKYRKLTRYNALEGGLKIKGTTLFNFDTESSITKKLRKPEEQLSEFAKLGKVKIRTFMENIKSKPYVPNGRINAQTLLLKAVS